MANFRSYNQFIYEVFLQRKKKNPSYSLRAFSRDLEIPVSRVSEIINGKVGISERRALQIADRLHFSSEEKSLFLDALQCQYGRSSIIKKKAKERIQTRTIEENTIDEDHFSLIADWYHLALLELVGIKSDRHKEEVLAAKLGVTVGVVTEALSRLTRLGFLRYEDGKYIATRTEGTTTNNIPSEAIRRFHRQILTKAEESLEKHNVQDRDHTAIVFSFNKKDLPEIKERIRQFRRQLSREYQDAQAANAVYCMSIQLFELTENL